MTMRAGGGLAAALVLALFPAGCLQTVVFNHSVGGTGPDGGGLGGSSFGGNNGSDGSVVGGDGSVEHVRCPNGAGAATPIAAQRVVSSIVIALDRSSSMGSHFGNGGSQFFGVARDALKDILNNSSYSSLIWFGYVEFPGLPSDQTCPNNGCCAGGWIPLVKGNNVGAIVDQMNTCSQVTCLNIDARPTGQAISLIGENTAMSNVAHYALLITDGEPSCSASGSSSGAACMQAQFEINKLQTANVPVSTFVVGVGDNITGQQDRTGGNACLNGLALAGGVNRLDSTAPAYYPAKSEDLLRSYLNTIVSGTACHMDVTDPNYDAVEVDIGSNIIPRDAMRQNGWDIDDMHTKITFYGAACDRFIASVTGPHQSAVVVKGCPNPR